MKEKGLYYAKYEFYQLIRDCGGSWNDGKHRPLVCLVESSEHKGLFWAIPMGKLNHRDTEGQERLDEYLKYPEDDIRSCFYHVGRTTAKSIFFISDVIPITEKYIDEEHLGPDAKHFIIKNSKLITELERKLTRILAVENSDKNHYRQHISDLKCYLIDELDQSKDNTK